MAFLQVQFFSSALNVASSVNVILPEPAQGIGIDSAGNEELPKVLYLLHGYSDDHSIWMRRTSVERYAAAHNLAVIMPAVNHSFYCNEADGERYWDYIRDELPEVCRKFFRISTRPEDTYTAGLSMGGYGAMKLALAYPERFAAAGCFSGAVDIADLVRNAPDRAGWQRIFGDTDNISGTDADTMYLMKKNSDAVHKPRLYISCGTADFLYPQHGRFVDVLRASGWDVTSFEKENATHEWGFWDEQIKAFIDFIYS